MTKDGVFMTMDEASMTKDGISLTMDEPSLTIAGAFTIKAEPPLTKNGLSMTKQIIFLTKEMVPMTKETISLIKERSALVMDTPSLVMETGSSFIAARRQTAANISALFQMAALCRDAATPMPPRAMPAECGRPRPLQCSDCYASHQSDDGLTGHVAAPGDGRTPAGRGRRSRVWRARAVRFPATRKRRAGVWP